MSGTSRSSVDLDPRRRRLLFRAWHRGMKEMDLIMGPYVDAEIERLDEAGLAELERLMDVPDPELLRWVTGETQPPPAFEGPVLRGLASAGPRR